MDQYQEYIAASRYARFVDDKQRRETWAETVNRYVDYIFSRTPAIQDKTELKTEIFDETFLQNISICKFKYSNSIIYAALKRVDSRLNG